MKKIFLISKKNIIYNEIETLKIKLKILRRPKKMIETNRLENQQKRSKKEFNFRINYQPKVVSKKKQIEKNVSLIRKK